MRYILRLAGGLLYLFFPVFEPFLVEDLPEEEQSFLIKKGQQNATG